MLRLVKCHQLSCFANNIGMGNSSNFANSFNLANSFCITSYPGVPVGSANCVGFMNTLVRELLGSQIFRFDGLLWYCEPHSFANFMVPLPFFRADFAIFMVSRTS